MCGSNMKKDIPPTLYDYNAACIAQLKEDRLKDT